MPPRDLLLCLSVPCIWGIAFTLAKPASEHFPPLFMLAGTFGAIALVFSILFRGPIRTPFWPGLLMASFAGSLQAIPLFMGLAGLDASLAVLVLQTQVPMAVVASYFINGETMAPRRLAGIALAFVGVGAVVGLPLHPPPLLPLLLVVLGAAVWAIGQALVKRIGRDEAPALFRLIALHSVPQLLIGSLLLEGGQIDAVASAGPAQWSSFLLVTFGGFMLGNMLWYVLLRRSRVDQVSPFLLLMPIVGVVVSAVVLGEELTRAHLVGGGLILAGLAVVVGIGARNKEREAMK